MNKKELSTLMISIRDVYGDRFPIDEGKLKSWYALLADLDADLAAKAVMAFCAQSPWPPTVADIRTGVAAGAVPKQAAEEAWEAVLAAVASRGRYRAPKFENPLTARTVDALGWQSICDATETGVLRAHFYRTYQAIRDGEVRDRNMGSLMGRDDVDRLLAKVTGQLAQINEESN